MSREQSTPATSRRSLEVVVVGGGWAGLAAAVRATLDQHRVTVLEASRHWGGRARTVVCPTPLGPMELDNGQHVLIGAYSCTLSRMKQVGVEPDRVLRRLPLTLLRPDGTGLKLPDWPAPLDVLAGILTARGWPWADKWALLARASRWQRAGFQCAPDATVAQLCQGLSHRLMQDFIDPLCVSALNTPAALASGQVFLTVLRDALFAGSGGSNLLIPTVPLGQLWPEPAAAWLQRHGTPCVLGHRVRAVRRTESGWLVDGKRCDAVVWANSIKNCPVSLVQQADSAHLNEVIRTPGLTHAGIGTVYAQAVTDGSRATLSQPVLALTERSGEPAQFVFDRGQLGGPPGLLAFVVSATTTSTIELTKQVVAQAHRQLGKVIEPIRTFVDKQATFTCTPNAPRPSAGPWAPGFWLAGDEVAGPYPATLEGAMRSGWDVAGRLMEHLQAGY